MKEKTINPRKDTRLEIEDESFSTIPYSDGEFNTVNTCWYVYSNPFVPMVDLTIVFAELKKMFGKWLDGKKKNANHSKKQRNNQRNKTLPILGVLLLLFAQCLRAQQTENAPTLRLEEIWKIAEANNRQLKLSDLNLRQGRLEVLEAKDHLLPELSVGGDTKLNSKFLIYDDGLFSSPQDVAIKGYGYAVGYSLNVNLFNGGKDKRNVAMKKEGERHRQYELDLQRHNVKYHVALAYFDLYKFLHFRDFISAEIGTQKKQLSIIESLHKNGIVLKSDVLRTSVKLSQLELNLSDIEKKIEIAKQQLNILMGRGSESELTINYKDSVRLDTIGNNGYDDYKEMALQQSPEYKMVNSDINWSELNIKQVKAMLLPKISLYSNYNYTYPQLSFYPYSNDLWGFGQTGIKVQYSIDNLYKSKHSIASAQLVRSQAKERAGIEKDGISIQVKEAYLEQQQALESLETAEKNISKNTETVRVIRNSYLNQESLLTDLLEAENALLEARFNLTTAQATLKTTHIRLLAIVGIL